jgi:hypothetical protein
MYGDGKVSLVSFWCTQCMRESSVAVEKNKSGDFDELFSAFSLSVWM